MVEDHDVGGVDEGKPQVLGHEVGGEPLAAGDHVLRGVLLDVAREGLELLGNRPLEAELVGDVLEALLDVGEKRRAVHVVLHVGVDQQEQVGDLVVTGEALAGGGDHHKAAVGVGLDDALDLAELLGRGDGRAAELCDLDHVLGSPSYASAAMKAAGSVSRASPRSARAAAAVTSRTSQAPSA